MGRTVEHPSSPQEATRDAGVKLEDLVWQLGTISNLDAVRSSLKAASEKASPGPWYTDASSGMDLIWDGKQCIAQTLTSKFQPDATLIVAAVNILRSLILDEAIGPLDWKLPHDVTIGHTKFRKGVSLNTLVEAARRWQAQAAEATGTEAARNASPQSDRPANGTTP